MPDKLEERKFSIVRNLARFYVDTVHLAYPNTMEIESLGETVINISHAAGEYRSEVSTKPGQLTWVRTLKLLPVDLPATAYTEYRQFFIDVAKADGRKVVLREKRTRQLVLCELSTSHRGLDARLFVLIEGSAEGGTVVAQRCGRKGAPEWEANRNPAEIVYLCRQDGSLNIEKITLHYIT